MADHAFAGSDSKLLEPDQTHRRRRLGRTSSELGSPDDPSACSGVRRRQSARTLGRYLRTGTCWIAGTHWIPGFFHDGIIRRPLIALLAAVRAPRPACPHLMFSISMARQIAGRHRPAVRRRATLLRREGWQIPTPDRQPPAWARRKKPGPPGLTFMTATWISWRTPAPASDAGAASLFVPAGLLGGEAPGGEAPLAGRRADRAGGHRLV
jgi:hypothetical protein